jgi:hypothetical protein
MLSYFQLLYEYFSLILIISPYIIYGYLWLFSITFDYFWLFHPTLFLVILSHFWYLPYFTLSYFSIIVIFLAILCYFWLF